jgi:hypothetical protein
VGERVSEAVLHRALEVVQFYEVQELVLHRSCLQVRRSIFVLRYRSLSTCQTNQLFNYPRLWLLSSFSQILFRIQRIDRDIILSHVNFISIHLVFISFKKLLFYFIIYKTHQFLKLRVLDRGGKLNLRYVLINCGIYQWEKFCLYKWFDYFGKDLLRKPLTCL